MIADLASSANLTSLTGSIGFAKPIALVNQLNQLGKLDQLGKPRFEAMAATSLLVFWGCLRWQGQLLMTARRPSAAFAMTLLKRFGAVGIGKRTNLWMVVTNTAVAHDNCQQLVERTSPGQLFQLTSTSEASSAERP